MSFVNKELEELGFSEKGQNFIEKLIEGNEYTINEAIKIYKKTKSIIDKKIDFEKEIEEIPIGYGKNSKEPVSVRTIY
jgi:hypothetical protein